MNLQEFGPHVRRLRLSRSLTQEQLAERAGLSADTIRRVENGSLSPSLGTLTKLGTGLQSSVAHLFAGMDDPASQTLSEIVDLLETRSPVEQETALRVLRALFQG